MLALALVLAPVQMADATPRPVLVEGVAAQCGEAVITSRELERHYERATGQNAPRTRAEALEVRREILVQLATVRLEEQAGADLGMDPQQIDLINRMNIRESRERAGLEAYLAELERQGKDAFADERDSEQQLLRILWEYSVQGNAVAGRRATKDKTIRPGELRLIYHQNLDQLAPERVQLRVLVVASEAVGGAEAARAACAAARERVLAGEDLALLVEELGHDLRDSRGLLPFWPVAAFRERLPDLAPFAADAEVGDLSEVLPLTDPRTGRPAPELGFQLAQIHDRETPEVPSFEDPEVQRELRKAFALRRREVILGRERARLRREAYLWVDPALSGGPGASAGGNPGAGGAAPPP